MYYIILGKNYMKLHIPLRTFWEKNAYCSTIMLHEISNKFFVSYPTPLKYELQRLDPSLSLS